ncbi:LexA family protein [Chryseobacterium foetidum]|uniref:LexA family protein n=1 Tax=Chryseobacterium foetidum TaxID=2951057 RepID=UPI0021C7F800|nr:S24 family peptidase [Chryseobacterium foetidum]
MILKKAENIYSEIEFFPVKKDGDRYYVEVHNNIANGFPSPAEDFSGKRISLDEKFLSKPEATFIGRAKGMSNYPFIMPGDYMIIRSDAIVQNGDLAIVYISGEGFSAKKIDLEKNCLTPLNNEFPEIAIGAEEIVETRGVVKTIFRDIESLNF